MAAKPSMLGVSGGKAEAPVAPADCCPADVAGSLRGTQMDGSSGLAGAVGTTGGRVTSGADGTGALGCCATVGGMYTPPTEPPPLLLPPDGDGGGAGVDDANCIAAECCNPVITAVVPSYVQV